MKAKYSLTVERMTGQEVDLAIKEFISCGWELNSSWTLGSHTFITFVWNKDTVPIYPVKYQPSK